MLTLEKKVATLEQEVATLRAALAAAQAGGADAAEAKGYAIGLDAAEFICRSHAVHYRGTEPIGLVASISGEPVGILFANAIRALRPAAAPAEHVTVMLGVPPTETRVAASAPTGAHPVILTGPHPYGPPLREDKP